MHSHNDCLMLAVLLEQLGQQARVMLRKRRQQNGIVLACVADKVAAVS